MKWIFSVFLFLSFSIHAAPLVIHHTDSSKTTLSFEQITQDIPSSGFATHLPWYEGTKSFTGMRVSDLIAHLGAKDIGAVSFVALNDYAATTTIADIQKYEPIVAYLMEGKRMKVRDRGPYWLVFNTDGYPETNNEVFYTQMVWQIDEIILHPKK
ncbi:hypothetical protein [Vibrio paucivorans]